MAEPWNKPWGSGAWHQAGGQRPKSPRGASPRSRGQKGKAGQKGGKAKADAATGKGKPKKDADWDFRAPTVDALPQAPSLPALPELREAMPGAAESNPDRQALLALMEHLGQQDDLPDSVRAVMAQYNQSSAKTAAKTLHRLVTQRQEAYASLERIKAARASFDAGWATYAQSLLDMLGRQFSEREQALTAMEESYSKWAMRLADSSQALKSAAKKEIDGVYQVDDSEDEGMEAEIDKTAQEAARMETRKQQLAEQHKQLYTALEAVRDTASEGADRQDKSGSAHHGASALPRPPRSNTNPRSQPALPRQSKLARTEPTLLARSLFDRLTGVPFWER